MPLLIQALQSENRIVRKRVAKALAYTKDPRTIEPLRQAVWDQGPEVRNQANWALSYLQLT